MGAVLGLIGLKRRGQLIGLNAQPNRYPVTSQSNTSLAHAETNLSKQKMMKPDKFYAKVQPPLGNLDELLRWLKLPPVKLPWRQI